MGSKLTALDIARIKRKERQAAGEVFTKKTPVEKLQKNPRSLRLAINAMCWECQGGGGDPKVNHRIKNCEVGKICPLYFVRPYQDKEK